MAKEEKSEKAEKPEKAEATAADGAAGEGLKKRFGPKMKVIMLVGGFALLQVILVGVVYMVVKMAHAPATVKAEEPKKADGHDAEPAETTMMALPVLPKDPSNKIRAVNAKSGQVIYWSLKVSLRVPKEQFEPMKVLLEANEDLVRQEITTVIGDSDPEILQQEADHATLKRRIRYALNNVLGKGKVNEVVIPECIPAQMN